MHLNADIVRIRGCRFYFEGLDAHTDHGQA